MVHGESLTDKMLDIQRILEIAEENNIKVIESVDGKHFILENGKKVEFDVEMLKFALKEE